jgi:hypothetical protein
LKSIFWGGWWVECQTVHYVESTCGLYYGIVTLQKVRSIQGKVRRWNCLASPERYYLVHQLSQLQRH